MNLTQTTYELQEGVALIRFNRPEQLNAFTPVMRNELLALFQEADGDDAVRAVVVTGQGRAFCAGADLSAGGSSFEKAQTPGQAAISRHRDGGGQVALAIFNCRKPVIAAINGPAVGVGITMTLPMDIRIAAEDAKIGFVFTRGAWCRRPVPPGFCPESSASPRRPNWSSPGGSSGRGKKAIPDFLIMCCPANRFCPRPCPSPGKSRTTPRPSR